MLALASTSVRADTPTALAALWGVMLLAPVGSLGLAARSLLRPRTR